MEVLNELVDFTPIKHSMKNRTHFFSPGARRFFNSHNSRNAIQVGQEVLFITSEKEPGMGPARFSISPRLYTVRCLNLETATITKVSQFQEYKNSRQAWKFLKTYCGR